MFNVCFLSFTLLVRLHASKRASEASPWRMYRWCIYPCGNDWHNSVTRVWNMCDAKGGMLITCRKLDTEQPILWRNAFEKRSSSIYSVTRYEFSKNQYFSSFFQRKSSYRTLVNRISFPSRCLRQRHLVLGTDGSCFRHRTRQLSYNRK